MTGRDLKNKFDSMGVPLRQIAELIGISEQNLQNKMASADIKVSFLCKLSKALNKSIYFFLNEQDYYQEISNKNNLYTPEISKLLEILENKDKEIKELYYKNGRLEGKIEHLESEIKKRSEIDALNAATSSIANVG